MNFDSSRPIYLQIIDYIKAQIIKGELKAGDKILSQRELAQKLKVNPNTVQRAYREMENYNLTETLRGQGTFIVASKDLKSQLKKEMAEDILKRFFMEVESLGYKDEEILDLVKQYQRQKWEGFK
ncbi:GntR family transcriptional regulator [Proteinivorax hydrogeniformans]|uniref:GntR family transcriptional regulator n=1 Tax=Proteinivorax hydrogeniformans TaxID=1826727 RepID=A0AAU8HUA3_9FIRM